MNSDHQVDSDYNPMKEDYYDPEFNSYNRGAGKQLASQLKPGHRSNTSSEGFRLYVRNVPAEIKEGTLKNIFSQCGEVMSIFVFKPKNAFTAALVVFSNLRDAENAIKELNDKPPFKLNVAFSEDDTAKESRLKKKSANIVQSSSFLNDTITPNTGKGRGVSRNSSNIRFNGYGVNPQKVIAKYRNPVHDNQETNYDNGYFNPYNGSSYDCTHKVLESVSINGFENRRSYTTGRGYLKLPVNEVVYQIQERSKEAFDKLSQAVGPFVFRKIKQFENEHADSLPSDYIREKCKKCGYLTNSLCSRCEKQFYCSRDCQMRDWPSHRLSCKKEICETKCLNDQHSLDISFDYDRRKFNGSVKNGNYRDHQEHKFQKLSHKKNMDIPTQKNKIIVSPNENKFSDNISPSYLTNDPFKNCPPNGSSTPFATSENTSIVSSTSPSTKKLVFTIGVPVTVAKTYAISDNDLHVIKKDNVLEFSKLSNELNEIITDLSPSIDGPVCVNKKCAAKFDETWYRAKVTSVNPLKVLYVDYGNEELVTNITELKELPKQFCSIFPFATRISIEESEVENISWIEGDIKTILPISKVDKLWHVKIVTSSDTSAPKTSDKTVNSTLNSDLTVSKIEESMNEEDNISCNFENMICSSTVSLNSQYKAQELDPSCSLLDDVNCTWKGRNVVEDLSVDSALLVSVEEILDEKLVGGHALCKTLPYTSKFIDLSILLSQQPLDPNYKPEEGDIVGVLYVSSEWTRGLIYSITPNGLYNVFLIDKSIRKDGIREVKKLPGASASYPYLGVTINFHDEIMNTISVGCMLKLNLISQLNDGWNCVIHKIEISDKKSVIQAEEAIGSGQLDAWEPDFVDDGRLKCLKLTTNSKVIITGGHSPKHIYLKPLTWENGNDISQTLEQEVAAHILIGSKFKKQPKLGDLVAAKWDADEKYYRAQVLKRQKNDSYNVIFVDYGNTATVKLSDMIELSPALKSHPCCAVKVGLKDVPMMPFTASALEYINGKIIKEDIFIVEFEDLSSVTLTYDKISFNERLRELMEPGWVRANAEQKDPCGGVILYRQNLPPLNKTFPENEVIELAALNTLIFNGDYIQFIMMDPYSDLFEHISENLSKEIEEYVKTLPSDDKYVPRTSELCIAKYADDGLYYRAECIEGYSYSANVIFIDYGNIGEVPYQDIHKFPLDFMTTPAMSVVCTSDIPYTKETLSYLKEIIKCGTKYKVKILKASGNEYQVVIPEVSELLKR